VDAAKRKALLEQIQERVATEQPLIPLYREDAIYASSDNVTFKVREDARVSLFDMRVK
ncbi:ABC transporter substrate-binding protein, partial [Salmonella enterica subsp. enterica serovar 4,12:i:-]|nr:ABC transporter substrate-binding protein [Salmonella enterica subsp. enterica serovar 4,12:i:-]